MRSLLTAVFMPICAWAGVTAVMEPSVPEFAGGDHCDEANRHHAENEVNHIMAQTGA